MPQVSADCSCGDSVFPHSRYSLLATGRPEWYTWYTWSTLTSVCLLPMRDTWHFQTTVGLEQSYFAWKDYRWAERCFTGERRGSNSPFALAEQVIQGQSWRLLSLGRTWVSVNPWNEGKAIVCTSKEGGAQQFNPLYNNNSSSALLRAYFFPKFYIRYNY